MVQLLNERETAKLLKMSIQGLRNWRCNGKGPRYLRVGGKMIRYSMEDLEKFIQPINPLNSEVGND